MPPHQSNEASAPEILDPRWALFVKVSELASLSRAAVALRIPQSMASRHIAQLETACGSKLFRRTGRGVVLTEFGQRIYPRIKALIADAGQLIDDMRTTRGVPMGTVKVGLLPATVKLIAGRLFADVLERFPHVHIHLLEGSSGQLEEWLTEGRVDFSLLLRDADSLTAGEPLIARQQLHLVCRKNSPFGGRPFVRFEELDGVPLVVSSRPHALRTLLDGVVRSKGIYLLIQAEADSIRLQHEIIRCGHIYGMMFGQLAPGEPGELEAVPIIEPTLTEAVVLAQTTHRPHTLATREVTRRLITIASQVLTGQ